MKKVLVFSLLLFIVSGVLLIMQWIGYEKISKASERIISQQEIELDVKKDRFEITQTIKLLSENEKVVFKLPADADKVSCSKGDICEIGGQTGHANVAGTTLTIYYQLPVPHITDSFSLDNWYAVFSDVKMSATMVMITDYTKRGGEWISSLEQTAAKQMSVIDFYSFQGKSGQAPLYWQKMPLVKSVILPNLIVYNVDHIPSTAFPSSIPYEEDKTAPQTVVITPNAKPEKLSGLTLVQSIEELKSVQNQIIYDYVSQSFILPESEKWMASFIAVTLYDIQPVFLKAADMKEEIAAQLTETEQTQWQEKLKHLRGKTVTIQQLDDLLGSVKGEETKFFTANQKKDTATEPLLFFDSRPVTIEGKETTFRMIKRNGILYVPLREAAESLGFRIQELSPGQEWVMKKELEAYHFYLNENRVSYNDRHYALYDTAFQNINGTMHVDKVWFQKIFLIEVQEKAGKIDLLPYEL